MAVYTIHTLGHQVADKGLAGSMGIVGDEECVRTTRGHSTATRPEVIIAESSERQEGTQRYRGTAAHMPEEKPAVRQSSREVQWNRGNRDDFAERPLS